MKAAIDLFGRLLIISFCDKIITDFLMSTLSKKVIIIETFFN